MTLHDVGVEVSLYVIFACACAYVWSMWVDR
jgi:hypothetical protein